MCLCSCVYMNSCYGEECGGSGGAGDAKIDFVKNLIAFHTPLTGNESHAVSYES